jgi:hypothetical protein
MSKVNANSWATNIGRSPRSEDKTCKAKIQQKIAVTLKERAKSASNILGRTRTVSKKETLDTHEVVTGVQLHRLQVHEDDLEETKDGRKLINQFPISHRFISQQRNDERELSRKTYVTGRPRTAFARYTVKKCDKSKDNFEFVEKSLKVMSISRYVSSNIRHHDEDSLKENPTEDKCCKDVPPHRTFRAKSAPPGAFYSSPDTYSDRRQNFHLPLFWKTRKSYHRKQQNLGTLDGNLSGDGNKGTQLRSLLQNKRTNSCEQSCPYKCRSCFRACLASDSYIQRQLDLKEFRVREAYT